MELPPVANAGADRTVGVGSAVLFDGSASFDPDGTIDTYAWRFGDGSMGTGAMASHTYNVAASFVVRLTVTDDDGLMSTDTATITVGQLDYDGLYSMEANPSMLSCSGLPATFVATTLRFTTNGNMITAETPDPEAPGGPPIRLTGTLTGAQFTVSGMWNDSQGGEHTFSISGTFTANAYMATMNETLEFSGILLCTLNWNVSGTKIE